VIDEFRHTSKHDEHLYEAVLFKMIERGVMPCPDALEPWFVCAAHTDEDVAKTLEVFDESLTEALG
jgi:glutamate-1-semialdehyde 2,1-aminomutase